MFSFVAQTAMDSYDVEDNRIMESEQRCRDSPRSDRKDSALSAKRNGKLREDNESPIRNRVHTRTRERNRDPDKDRISDGEQSSVSFYSDDYENASASDGSFSPRSPSPLQHRGTRTQRASSSPRHATGIAMCSHTHTHTVCIT